jgi:hypothetical protein
MGEGKDRVEPGPTVDEAGERVQRARARLDTLVSELDQRRHVVTTVKRAVGDNPLPSIAGAVLGLGAMVGAVVLVVQHQQKRSALRRRAGRLREALARMIDKPNRVASSGSTVPGKILAAAGSAVASLLAKRLFEKLIRPPTLPGRAQAKH